jgi:MoaA/NifB/PqqE/SkfB family radical SAM enzyme
MRHYSQSWDGGHLLKMFNNVRRRRQWFIENASPSQVANAVLAFGEFSLKKEVMHAWPIMLKIDISPLCNLRCTFCVHARPSPPSANSSENAESLTLQSFKPAQKMSLAQFTQIINEVRGKCMAVSLYYLGDPLVHPDLDAMCAVAASARINSHISTNFSFNLSDDRIVSLVRSGLTHLTVCVDGMTQESYERTRVGGRLDVVLSNLRRVLEARQELARKYPRVEVQFIKFQHNIAELDEAVAWATRHGVDRFTDYWGYLHNYTDFAPGTYEVIAPRSNGILPRCTWPYFSMQIKYNGDVIPCCYHRESEQYADGGADARIVGNVLKSSVWAVWTAPEYQALRRVVANPQRARTEPHLRETFCDGCTTIFETNARLQERRAQDYRWEDLYVRDERGRVLRKNADSSRQVEAPYSPG